MMSAPYTAEELKNLASCIPKHLVLQLLSQNQTSAPSMERNLGAMNQLTRHTQASQQGFQTFNLSENSAIQAQEETCLRNTLMRAALQGVLANSYRMYPQTSMMTQAIPMHPQFPGNLLNAGISREIPRGALCQISAGITAQTASIDSCPTVARDVISQAADTKSVTESCEPSWIVHSHRSKMTLNQDCKTPQEAAETLKILGSTLRCKSDPFLDATLIRDPGSDVLPFSRRRCSSEKFFPDRLYTMLEEADQQGLSEIVSFLPHGRAFIVRSPERFVKEIMPRYFSNLSKWSRYVPNT
jgi:HSF-type DNA-binding